MGQEAILGVRPRPNKFDRATLVGCGCEFELFQQPYVPDSTGLAFLSAMVEPPANLQGRCRYFLRLH